MSEKFLEFPNIEFPNIEIGNGQKVLSESIIQVIKPTKEQLDVIKKFADDIGIPDTLEGLDE
jgi:putative lipoic acid-binding regulatory protein